MRTVAATPDLVPFLLARMGPARVATVQRSCGGQAEPAIVANIASSTLTWCGLDDDGVVTMGGIQPIPQSDSGYLWQYVTDVARHKRAYVQQQRAILLAGLDQYQQLVTIIEADYRAALRHMRRLGFAISMPVDFNGHLGCLCERSR